MKLLTLDTSTEACTCALYVDGDISQRFEIAPRRHTELILPMAEALLAEADLRPTQLDAIAFGQGPGSFTGIRIACGVTQGIAFAADIPAIPISSLATLAQTAFLTHQATQVLTAFDARMQEVYFAHYQLDNNKVMQCVSEEVVCSPDQVTIPTTQNWFGAGEGWQSYQTALLHRLGKYVTDYQSELYPQAKAMIPLALAAFEQNKVVSAEHVLPRYLRNKVADK